MEDATSTEPEEEYPFTEAEFAHRLNTDPTFLERLRSSYEAALALPESPETSELQEQARSALRLLKHQQGLTKAGEAMTQLAGAVQDAQAGHDLPSEKWMRDLCDEAQDNLLDVQEPHRTAFMKQVSVFRAKLDEVYLDQ